MDPDAVLLRRHLRGWLGAWPPRTHIDVVGSARRDAPGWDGRVHRLVGIATPHRALLSVPPQRVARVRAAVDGARLPLDDVTGAAIVDALDAVGEVVGVGVFRWSTAIAGPSVLPDLGDWVDRADPRVPAWLRPFNAPQVLLVPDDGGGWSAGVGIKRHDPVGHELAVVTQPEARGRGLARHLVARAARRVLADGGLPTYLHGPANDASARVADAVGFPDRGWRVHGMFAAAG